MIKPGKWKVENELQKIVEKLMDLKLQKTETNGNFLSQWKFFSRAIEISRQFCASSNSFLQKKINRCAGPYHMFEKVKKSYECPKQSGVN